MKKYLILLLFLCSGLELVAGYLYTSDPDNPVVEQFTCITMPKGGTHLLDKLLKGIAKELGVKATGRDGLYYSTHTMEVPAYKWARDLKLILIRDPRDALVSCVDWVDYHVSKGGASQWFQTHWPRMSFKQKIHTLIFPIVPEQLMVFEYINIVPFFHDDKNLVVRFEDLVGEKGGGSKELQISTIRNILNYLHIQFDDERIESLAEEIWGSSATFNRGVIGRWVEYLNDVQIKKWVNFRLGDVIQDFGYANKHQW